MITDKELRIVNELMNHRDMLASIIRSFNSKHVWTKVGLIGINAAMTRDPQPSEYASFFHTQMKDLEDELTQTALTRIKHEIKVVDLELSKYVSIDKEGS